MADVVYPPGFYANQKDASFRAASAVVPVVIDLVRPKSVVDVGCGVGTWAAAFMNAGITDVVGIDGDYVDRSQLMIPAELFQTADLNKVSGNNSARKFDLAYSLEVAEHLETSQSANFVEFLTSLAPVVMFGAAIPGQGGRHHINEQWPDFWINLFKNADYDAADTLRPKIWDMEGVPFWYQQNTLIFSRRTVPTKNTASRIFKRSTRPFARQQEPDARAATCGREQPRRLVHPILYQKYRSELTRAEAKIKQLEKELRLTKGRSGELQAPQ